MPHSHLPHRHPLFRPVHPWGVLMVVLGLLLPAGGASAQNGGPPHAGPPLVVALGDLRGEIKPCGCSPEGQMGGLPRRLTYLAQWLGKSPGAAVLVDLGNNFPPPSPQGDLKVALIQRLLGRFPPDAILPGPNELAYGVAALDRKLPYLVSNDAVGKVFLSHRTVVRSGLRIGLFGYLSPGEVYQGSQAHFRLLPADAALLKKLAEIGRREFLDLALLLFRGSDEEAAVFARAGLFDHIFSGNPSADELNQVVLRRSERTTMPQVPTKGQGAVRLKLMPGMAPYTVDWLTDAYADHADATKAFAEYDARVKALFFASLETREKRKAESPYVGAAQCAACHQAAAAIWKASRHAGALPTLEKVGKQYDPECLACHVVGLNDEGFLSQKLTPQLAGVQCENCHGPGRAHMLNPKANRTGHDPSRANGETPHVGEAVCRTCHMGSHSPTFDFQTYWPKIRHGGVPALAEPPKS